ncbi:hypothetical protein BD780_001820 [Clostridium tetanomorphum]|uniref:Uncharacterized protein n=1 Tax=Clostridium tetanomorphum TaxID=1553 RepID=A0A923ED20_CLOTT|nr:hypothetical protein [Clostridium tetanomorphum]MBC2399817.1 hypothetical protein [Clostridium tetanomorphum]MBP1864182.1 hypothetical protein [Clostridium tetanomorphum]NRS84595.1 hypothetical protein [Clostridium tetanomorphum]NRZ97810.1 hypothetical protein [Clostridium tetanomorphum]SQB91905.1 Uncharacterised protein [Clostridium tetanomorphum]
MGHKHKHCCEYEYYKKKCNCKCGCGCDCGCNNYGNYGGCGNIILPLIVLALIANKC